MRAYGPGDPLAQQRPQGVGGQVGVAGVLTRAEQPPDGVHQPGHLELLVGRASPTQQRGGPHRVLVRIDGGAPAVVRHLPAAPAGVQQNHQLPDAVQFHASFLPSPPAINPVATQEQGMVGLRCGQQDLNYVPRAAIRWVVGPARGSSTQPNG
ncbi:hypothetical protein [Streptomyces sp. NPDC012510]|uniref:hypothetical protein n=1 Tax=Streptomyces sp. NPDC012510 TaxID=3364838 RepID=UPI0036EDFE66